MEYDYWQDNIVVFVLYVYIVQVVIGYGLDEGDEVVVDSCVYVFWFMFGFKLICINCDNDVVVNYN